MKLSTKLQGIGYFLILIAIALLGYKAITKGYSTMVGTNECIDGELEIESGILKMHKLSTPPETDPEHYIVYLDDSGRLSVKFPDGTIKGINWHSEP